MPPKKPVIRAKSKAATTAPSIKIYAQTLANLKNQIIQAQIKATTLVHTELLRLYWEMGKIIAEKQQIDGWGSGTIEKLANDLQNSFPGLEGFSRRNIFRMQAFYAAYQIVPQAVAQFDELPIFKIPWGHNTVLLEKLKTLDDRLWYAHKTLQNGWSRSILEMQITAKLHKRLGQAPTNFQKTLAAPQSDLAHATLKDPYIIDFIELNEEFKERDVEQGLIDHIQQFLLELGQGFAFVGRQYHLYAGEKDYYIDLLFYHINLSCYVVIELKTTEFKPEYAGKLNFYLAAVDDLIKKPTDQPSIGLLLCSTKNNVAVEYALSKIDRPIGVANYATKLVSSLPKKFAGKLPSVKELEAELAKQEELIRLRRKTVRMQNVTKKQFKPKL